MVVIYAPFIFSDYHAPDATKLLSFHNGPQMVSTYNSVTQSCTDGFTASISKDLTAISFDIKELSRPEALRNAVVGFTVSETSTAAAEALVYVVVPPDANDSSYISACKYRYFEAGVRFGPIIWERGAVTVNENIFSSNLAKILTPIIRSNDTYINNSVFIVFHWHRFKTRGIISLKFWHLKLKYEDKKPSKFNYVE